MTEAMVTAFITVVGSVTILASTAVCYSFYKQRGAHKDYAKKLTTALSWQTASEVALLVGTLLFAISSYFGWMREWNFFLKAGIRLSMFTFAAMTTIHLWRTINNSRNQ